MKRVKRAIAMTAFGLSFPSIAFAQGTPPETEGGPGEPVAPIADRRDDDAHAKEATPERWRVTLDAVLGFGATPVVTQRVTGPLLTQESRALGSSRFATQSLNLGLSYDVVRDLKVYAMLPIGTGGLHADDSRGASIVGNFAVGAQIGRHIRKDVALVGALEVALPTANGDELPTADELAKSGHIDQSAYDRYSVQKAISASRGREDTASFAPKHLGLVPKVGVVWTGIDRLEVEGFAKYSSLHATGTNSAYEGSFVVGARGSYRLHKLVDGTLRLWTNIPTAGGDSAIAAAEPQLRGHFGSVMPVFGVILPIAGELTDPYAVGVRLAVAGTF